MNPAQFDRFAIALAEGLLATARQIDPWRAQGESLEQYALDVSLLMLEKVQTHGVEAIMHYHLVTQGAFRLACEALGIENNLRSIERFLEQDHG